MAHSNLCKIMVRHNRASITKLLLCSALTLKLLFSHIAYAVDYGVVEGTNRITMPYSLGSFFFHPTLPFAYATGKQTNTVTVFRVNQHDGSMVQIASPINSGGIAPSFGSSIDPTGNYLYIPNTDSNNVTQFAINQTTGTLTQVSNVKVSDLPDGNNYPFTVAFAPSGKHVYIPLYNSNSVAIFDVNPQNGNLIYRKRIITGTLPIAIVFNYDGKYAILNNQGINKVQLFKISDDGDLTLIQNFATADMINPFFAAPHPDGIHFYIASYSNNRLIQVKLNTTETPSLEYINSVDVRGIGPNTFIPFSNDLQYAYEGNYDDNTLSMFKVTDGVLHPLPPFKITVSGYGIIQCRRMPNSNFIYSVNSISNDLSVYKIRADGTLIPHIFKDSLKH